MQLNPLTFSQLSPQTLKPPPQPLATPTAQAALATAALMSQPTAAPTRTQTAQAPQAAGKADQPRQNQTATDVGHAKDTLAGATTARANGTGYGGFRGTRLDLSV